MNECLMFGLDLESRCLGSMADEDSVRFLVGTHNIKLDNQICELSVEGDHARVASRSFPHSGEIRALAASSSDVQLFACCTADYRNTSPAFSTHLYRLNHEKNCLDDISTVELDKCSISLEWESQNNRASAADGSGIRLLDITNDLKTISTYQVAEADSLLAQSWSPHNNSTTLGLAVGRDVHCLDIRTMNEGLSIKEAHAHRTLHLDFNPNLQHVIATCGDDGAVRLWDWRKPGRSIFALRPHAHWVWQVRFHPVHDQLLLTAGSDACVVLSCVQSVSSEAATADDDEDEEAAERLVDGQLERIDEHEESVYACSWSASDPWAFASLSYDGRIVISRVKRKHKYAIMQL